MRLLSFKEWLKEKATYKVDTQWFIVSLDDGTELSTSIKYIEKGIVQIALPKDRFAKEYKVTNKMPIVKTIENVLGYKLDLTDKKIVKFIELYPCSNIKN